MNLLKNYGSIASHQEKFLKDLIIENNKFHELISKDFKSFKNPTIKNLTEPDDAGNSIPRGITGNAGIPTPFFEIIRSSFALVSSYKILEY